MRDRGVSEVVGFVLVFGIMVLTITVVSVTGYVGLEHARDFERANNAQSGMEILAENVEELTREGAPSRTTELRLADGKVSLGAPIEITVSGERVTNPDENFTHAYTVRPIVHDLGTGTKLVYVGGALVREEAKGAVMVRKPDLVLANRSAVIPIVRPNAVSDSAIGGTSTVLVHAEDAGSEIAEVQTTRYELTLNVTSPRATVWRDHLGAYPATSCTLDGTTTSCTLHADRTFVTARRVGVRFG